MKKDPNGQRLPTITKEGIYGFFGKYRFLSNFHPCNILFDNIMFPSVEHAYVAAKTFDYNVRKEISLIKGPVQVKSAGRKLQLPVDWDHRRLIVMTDLVLEKFRDASLQKELILTGDKYLEETNDWDDKFWGVDSGVGHNMLGKILMLTRERYR